MTARKSNKLIVYLLLVLFLAGLASIGVAALSPGKGSGKNHAILIGIGNYRNWPDLKSPPKDAELIARALTQKYNFRKSNITLLTDDSREKPTLINILTILDRHINDLTENDNLLVFFSGHSVEDEDGETYWIPSDGKKDSKIAWIKHSSLSEELFGSEKFKAKNLCIVSDSPFSSKLIRKFINPLSPYDLRYPEKIMDRAAMKSREVIAFGEQHWEGSKNTNGMGLFAFYFHKALTENALGVIDIENLLFDENVYNPIRKIAGTRLVGGRLELPSSKRGQFIIARLAPSPIVDIVDALVNPEKGYPGDTFTVAAKTSLPASEVYLEVKGQKLPMKGSGTDWQYSLSIDQLGSTPFTVTAVNPNDIEGKPAKGRFTTVKARAPVSNVTEVSVNPKKGLGGDRYAFSASTDKPATKVALLVKGERYSMSGSGTRWTLAQKIDHIGAVDFSIIASNEDGVEGQPKAGSLSLEAGISNVVEVKATPKIGYAGEEFTISVKTDRTADGVTLEIDGKAYAMKGSGDSWSFKKTIPDIGTKQFSVVAKNVNGQTGKSLGGQILTKKSPLPIPEIASVDVGAVGPGKGYAGDSFAFRVNTTAPSDSVTVDIEGKQYAMKGSGTQWSFQTKIEKLGPSKFEVVAKNKDGVQGGAKTGEITTVKKPAAPVNVTLAQVSPKTGERQKDFAFTAKTDKPAKTVTLVIGQKRYAMAGSGTEWYLNKKLDQTGDVQFSIVAKNNDDAEGGLKSGSLVVIEQRYKDNKDGTITDLLTQRTTGRFVDNNDGTVTDLLTSLMWLKQPKQIALKYDEAVEFCREIKITSYAGWRLPTIDELVKLSDKSQQNPALPANHPFSGILTHLGYWSKTKHKFGPKYVQTLDMWRGRKGYQKKEENAIVWPVRYAETSEKG